MTLAAPPLADTGKLRSLFRQLSAASCPRSYNFHLHTICSDGQLTPEQIIDQAIAIGLKGLAITDHHSVRGYLAASRYLAHLKVPCPPTLYSGIEITAQLLGVEVHILGYGFEPEHPSLIPYQQRMSPMGQEAEASAVISALHQAQGIAILAHPARYKRSAPELIEAAVHRGIDGVETFYCYGNAHPWQPTSDTTLTVGNLAAMYHLLQTCGTDTHGSNILVRI
ncbi:PHP domain-containing protein [Candidatus Synechococcus calcipolaris G9]|uniref:PHP domain-containing protein n=1 Tax=Candidatus Synechococcus calcipolaris G9 TaxID=1497997 RepID=A0ABT6F2J6_9SYNE|nr:PHP domain-containing protein [Candidatus Synechococcus calcipolaris]MDG2992063.1 PHP domain-containing protein [Candidatus Synechococcus calcipolaris G9]